MLPMKNSLPATKCHGSVNHRYRDVGGGDRGSDVRWHVVPTLGSMRIQPSILGNRSIHPCSQVIKDARVCILLNDQAGRGMPNEN